MTARESKVNLKKISNNANYKRRKMTMKYNYINKEFDTKFLVVGKEKGCSSCDNLKAFLKHGVQGKYDDEITNINFETNPEDYQAVIDETGAMRIPVIVNTETGDFVTGFDLPELLKLLRD